MESFISESDKVKFSDDILMIQILFLKVVMELYNIGYLNKNFKPEQCKNCKCGTFVYYSIKSYCRCVLKYTSLDDLFKNITNTESLILISEALTNKTALLKPFFNDVIMLYKVWGNNLMIKYPADLQWNVSENRLILNIC
jgi:hypothetical protein